MVVPGRVGVVLGDGSVGYHEYLDVLEQTVAGPEALLPVPANLVERLADVDSATLELHVDDRKSIAEDGDIVTIRMFAVLCDVLMDHLKPVAAEILLVDDLEVEQRTVITCERETVVNLEPPGLGDDGRIVGTEEVVVQDVVPLRI